MGILKRSFGLNLFLQIFQAKSYWIFFSFFSLNVFALPCSEVLKAGTEAFSFFYGRPSVTSVEKVINAWVEKNAPKDYYWEPVAEQASSTNPFSSSHRALAIELPTKEENEKTEEKDKAEKKEKRSAAILNFLLDLKDRTDESSIAFVTQDLQDIRTMLRELTRPLPMKFDVTSATVQAAVGWFYWPIGVYLAGYHAYRFCWQPQINARVLHQMNEVAWGRSPLPDGEIVAVRVQSRTEEWNMVLLYAPSAEILNQEPSRLQRAWRKGKEFLGFKSRKPPQKVLTLLSLKSRGVDDSNSRLSIQTQVP